MYVDQSRDVVTGSAKRAAVFAPVQRTTQEATNFSAFQPHNVNKVICRMSS